MAKLGTLTLRVTDADAQRTFYRDVLGMSDLGDDRLGYSEQEVALRFVAAETPYIPQPTDLYWKIAISVPNIDLAYTQLTAAGAECSAPNQFRDVGYLAKVTDPEGFTVELIDHHFKGDRPGGTVDETRLGGGPHLSLVTLRSADIAAVEPEILGCGMTPLSIQPVTPFGFTLYFYAFTEDTPPNPDLKAVENRTWVYRRRYTVLEIQHVHALTAEIAPAGKAGGYGGLAIVPARVPAGCGRLLIAPLSQSR